MRIALIFSIVFLSSCATNPAGDPIQKTEELLKQGAYDDVYVITSYRLGSDKEYEQAAKALFEKYPGFSDWVTRSLTQRTNTASDKKALFVIVHDAKLLRDNGVISQEYFERIIGSVNKVAVEKNVGGQFDFLLSDKYQLIPSLREPKQEWLVFLRSVQTLKTDGKTHLGLVEKVFAFTNSNIKAHEVVAEALPTMKLTVAELKSIVAPQFPKLAEEAINARIIPIVLIVQGNKLLQYDLREALSVASDTIRVVETQQKAAIITVEELQYQERQIQETSETIAYPRYEVSTGAALMLMPRDSTYMFDRRRGGIEIAYAYSIEVKNSTGNIHREVFRNQEKSTYTTCANQRIKNVFGGESAAQFVANDDMRSKCSDSTGKVSFEELRKRIIRGLADHIVRIPSLTQPPAITR